MAASFIYLTASSMRDDVGQLEERRLQHGVGAAAQADLAGDA